MAINRRFATYAWIVLAINVLVIIWGAFVRATGSGAGCGSNWPLCQGEVIPRATQVETLIEFSHRISSGIALIAVVVLLIWSFRAYPRGSLVRKGAIAVMIFMIIEALIGAALVLLEYVAFNVSVGRAIWMAGHLVNTFLLLGALTLTAWWASGGGRLRWRGQGALAVWLLLALAGMFVLGISGAITALGDTLVLTGGISPQENALVATFVDLRIYHPMIAVGVGALVAVAAVVAMNRRPSPQTQRLGWALIAIFVVQLVLGAMNVALKAPVWLQMVHLFVTSIILILLVLLAAAALSAPAAQQVTDRPIEPAPVKEGSPV